MQTKLTLRLEKTLIRKAKIWAKKRDISLSQAVAEFFSQVAEEEKGKTPELNPWTRRLSGAASGKGKPPTDEEIRRERLEALEAKHR